MSTSLVDTDDATAIYETHAYDAESGSYCPICPLYPLPSAPLSASLAERDIKSIDGWGWALHVLFSVAVAATVIDGFFLIGLLAEAPLTPDAVAPLAGFAALVVLILVLLRSRSGANTTSRRSANVR